jgi:hypothetical protein
MRPAEDIKKLIKNLNDTTSAQMDERVLEDALHALEESEKTTSASIEPNRWRIIMKSPITKLAVAAVVIIACLIGISFWRTSGSGIALADVLARVEKVKAVRSKFYIKISGDPNYPWSLDNPRSFEIRETFLTSQEYGSISTITEYGEHDPNVGESTLRESYFLPQKKLTIVIEPNQKRYTRYDDSQVDWHENQKFRRDPLAFLKEIADHKHKSLGRSTIDGNEVEVFQSTDPNYFGRGGYKNRQVDAKIWVDVKTRLPVRYDQRITAQRVYDGKWSNQQYLYYDFQWDVPVDAAKFEPVIPDGYKIADNFPELANEETAIQGLKQCVELLGNYPERIALSYLWSEVEKSDTPAALRLKEEIKGLTGFDRDQKKMDALKPMRFLNKFYLGPASKDSAYYGETVTPKDADKVLMRWKVSDNEYRVIYGDLHAETVTPEKLAELEKALPK